MTEKVFVRISGLHTGTEDFAAETENTVIEAVSEGTYYFRNGKHFIIYEETLEGFPGTVKNIVKITGTGRVEIQKKGLINTVMVFEKGRRIQSDYRTPYVQMQVETETEEMKIDVSGTFPQAEIRYSLSVNGERLSDCRIRISVLENKDISKS